MKKIILSLVAVMAFGVANAQETKFGVMAGVDFASSKAKFAGFSATSSETGFFVGGFADIAISDKFHVQPELLYVSIEDLDQISIPILAKFNVAKSFNVLAGPSLAFIMDTADGIKSLNYGFDLGASYDINEQFMIEARYDLGLANLLEGGDSDNSLKLNGVFVGVGYKF